MFFLLCYSLSYPIGRYFLINHCENNLVKCSLFSTTIFATIVAITTNLAPIFAKYVIFIFYLVNLSTLVISSKIRNDLLKAIISFRFILLFIFVIFLVINEIFKVIFIDNNELVYFFGGHDAYYFDPIAEVLTSDYFTRLKISSLYPLEWGSYHFFEASFNSIFLLPIYQSGIIGLVILKNFYYSIFVISLKSIELKRKYFLKEIIILWIKYGLIKNGPLLDGSGSHQLYNVHPQCQFHYILHLL